MEWDDEDDLLRRKGEPKGINLRKLTQVVNSCGVTFSVWAKKDGDRKGSGNTDWTSLMGDEEKKLLQILPANLENEAAAIHPNTAKTVIKLWKVSYE